MAEPGEYDSSILIAALEPKDVDRLRVGWWSRTDAPEILRLLAAAPGLSVWIPGEHEYLLVGPWRHRDEVVHMQELVSIRHAVELTDAAIKRAKAAGARLFLSIEMSERRPDSFYRRAGLSLVETVQSYELIVPRGMFPTMREWDMQLVDELTGDVLKDLTTVDWSAFPWLWRNSHEEFQEYFAQPGVEIYLLREAGAPIGYLGITVFPGWGHIDRLAIAQHRQGNGYGRALTEFAINRLIALGAIRIGLSTQQRNGRSQTLYSRLGFRRQVSGDYRIFGCTLSQIDSIDELVIGHKA